MANSTTTRVGAARRNRSGTRSTTSLPSWYGTSSGRTWSTTYQYNPISAKESTKASRIRQIAYRPATGTTIKCASRKSLPHVNRAAKRKSRCLQSNYRRQTAPTRDVAPNTTRRFGTRKRRRKRKSRRAAGCMDTQNMYRTPSSLDRTRKSHSHRNVTQLES